MFSLIIVSLGISFWFVLFIKTIRESEVHPWRNFCWVKRRTIYFWTSSCHYQQQDEPKSWCC
jgi:hypothetical protein